MTLNDANKSILIQERKKRVSACLALPPVLGFKNRARAQDKRVAVISGAQNLRGLGLKISPGHRGVVSRMAEKPVSDLRGEWFRTEIRSARRTRIGEVVRRQAFGLQFLRKNGGQITGGIGEQLRFMVSQSMDENASRVL